MSSWIRNNRGFLAFVLLLGLFRTAIADWNPIPSGSMQPTLMEGDVVFVNRLAYDIKLPLTDHVLLPLAEPQRGDIVTFTSPRDGVRLIKRIVALPGDRIAMREKRLIVNGEPAHYVALAREGHQAGVDAPSPAQRYTEQVANKEHAIQWLRRVHGYDSFPEQKVPDGHYLMLGDNRDNSADSRYIGLVPRQLLIGRAVRVLLSVDILGAWLPRLERFGLILV